MSEISAEAKAAAKVIARVNRSHYSAPGRDVLERYVQDAIDASKKPSMPPLPVERGWSKNADLVLKSALKATSLNACAWTLAMFACHKAGALGNPNLHHGAITKWLAPFWDDTRDRKQAIDAFIEAAGSEDFTAAKAQAPIWKTILAPEALGNWKPAQKDRNHKGFYHKEL